MAFNLRTGKPFERHVSRFIKKADLGVTDDKVKTEGDLYKKLPKLYYAYQLDKLEETQ